MKLYKIMCKDCKEKSIGYYKTHPKDIPDCFMKCCNCGAMSFNSLEQIIVIRMDIDDLLLSMLFVIQELIVMERLRTINGLIARELFVS